MAKNYLIVNIGSQSKKYTLFNDAGQVLQTAHLEDERYRDPIPSSCFAGEVVVGLRLVAPGEYFLTHRLVDDDCLARLREAAQLAPLHVTPVLAEIKQIQQDHPQVPIYAISDSAYYATRPLVSKLYGLPQAEAEKYGLYRFGYHGLSIASAMAKLGSAGAARGRVIICHLGGGVSVVALRDGAVLETSMGFTPLEGPVMSSRVGNIDAGAVVSLLKIKNCSPDELEQYFNEACGLRGVSGRSDSVRELLELENEDQKAKLALELFVWTIKKSIGAALALLGGVDTLVFTATIGERSATMRERLVAGLGDLGITLDQGKNLAVPDPVGSVPLWIQAPDSRAKIAVLHTAEDEQIFTILGGLHH